MESFHGTTIVSVRDDATVAVGGDGQVSIGDTVMKGNAVKVRKLFNNQVIAGFAGSTADAFTLFEKFEAALEKYGGQLTRAAVELAKEWRSDRALRRLEAMLIVADKTATLLISGNGDVIDAGYGTAFTGLGDPRNGTDYEREGRGPAHSQYANDWTFGLQWQPHSRVMLAGEYHYVDGTAWLPVQDNPDPEDTERRWNMWLFQLSLRF